MLKMFDVCYKKALVFSTRTVVTLSVTTDTKEEELNA